MSSRNKSRAQLVAELMQLRSRVDQLERTLADPQPVEGPLYSGCRCVAGEKGEEAVGALQCAQDALRKAHDELKLRNAELTRLNKSLREQALLLELAHDAIIVRGLASEGKVLYWNEGAVRMFGWSKEEAVGSATRDLINTQFPIPLEEIKRHLFLNGEWEGELVHTGRSGAAIVVSSRWVLQRDDSGEPVAILEINRDITGRKRAEQALRLSEEHFRRTFDLSPIGAAIVGLDYRFQRVNEALCRITGYSKDELEKLTFVDITHPDDLRDDLGMLERLTQAEIDQYQIEKRYIRKNGQIAWIQLHARMVRDASGNPLYFLPMMVDITERKADEERIQNYTLQLENSNRELQDFAFIASHDLQEPLRKIQVFANRVRSKYGASLDGPGQDYLERMCAAAARMRDLIDDLLRYSRFAFTSDTFSPVHLTQCVQDAVADLRVLMEDTGGVVEVEDLPTIEADPVQMRQLFQNLIGNSLRYHHARPLVKVYSSRFGDGLCRIFVEDNGIGFDEKYADRVFRPFQRLHGKNSPYEGTGMGLAICRKIVEHHHGGIMARSIPGVGSTFIVTLPLKQKRLGELNERA